MKTHLADLELLKRLAKRELADDVRGHEHPPLHHVGLVAVDEVALDLGHGGVDLLLDHVLAVGPDAGDGQGAGEHPPARGRLAGVRHGEEADADALAVLAAGPVLVPLRLVEAGADAVDRLEVVGAARGQLVRRDAHQRAVPLVQVVDIVHALPRERLELEHVVREARVPRPGVPPQGASDYVESNLHFFL